jgi:hypothetical protein
MAGAERLARTAAQVAGTGVAVPTPAAEYGGSGGITCAEAHMLEHRDPDCTGTWTLEPDEGGGRGRVRCPACEASRPATLEATLDAMKENLLSVQLIALGLTGRLP